MEGRLSIREPMSLVNLSKINGESGEEELNLHLTKHKAKATRHIFLIRHSQYKLEGKTDADRVLTSLGREQAELTGQRLSNLGFKYSQIVHSSMTRARETMEIISKYLPVVPIPLPPNTASGVDTKNFYLTFSHAYTVCKNLALTYFVKELPLGPIPRSVTGNQMLRALQLPPEAWLRMSLNNGSITYLVVRPSGNVSLRMLGDSGFMPPEKISRT
ncbi:unnamed protein product [Ranitomeya imitator]|uniref:Serine/threonine-protein phosphatase PGAM5, mitochondrial n=1 Tax=Ranitomeya imitator TaxID=111125 RepID=A0ABN9LUW2_9NEOB|nr:unnamed protein product [Ranitomeya imitator]